MTNRKRSMYNLKPHSAFKLLTMAAGYKVFCPVAGFVDAKCGGEGVGERDAEEGEVERDSKV